MGGLPATAAARCLLDLDGHSVWFAATSGTNVGNEVTLGSRSVSDVQTWSLSLSFTCTWRESTQRKSQGNHSNLMREKDGGERHRWFNIQNLKWLTVHVSEYRNPFPLSLLMCGNTATLLQSQTIRFSLETCFMIQNYWFSSFKLKIRGL